MSLSIIAHSLQISFVQGLAREHINLKLKSCPCALTEHHTIKAYWGIEV